RAADPGSWVLLHAEHGSGLKVASHEVDELRRNQSRRALHQLPARRSFLRGSPQSRDYAIRTLLVEDVAEFEKAVRLSVEQNNFKGRAPLPEDAFRPTFQRTGRNGTTP